MSQNLIITLLKKTYTTDNTDINIDIDIKNKLINIKLIDNLNKFNLFFVFPFDINFKTIKQYINKNYDLKHNKHIDDNCNICYDKHIFNIRIGCDCKNNVCIKCFITLLVKNLEFKCPFCRQVDHKINDIADIFPLLLSMYNDDFKQVGVNLKDIFDLAKKICQDFCGKSFLICYNML